MRAVRSSGLQVRRRTQERKGSHRSMLGPGPECAEAEESLRYLYFMPKSEEMVLAPGESQVTSVQPLPQDWRCMHV